MTNPMTIARERPSPATKDAGAASWLSAAEIAQFQASGYVRLKGVLSDHQVDVLRAAVKSGFDSFNASPNSYNVTAAADALWGAAETYKNETSTQHDLDAIAKAIAESDLPRLLDALQPGQPRGSFILDTGVW